jgi:polyhydroxybutyrate depolymerase
MARVTTTNGTVSSTLVSRIGAGVLALGLVAGGAVLSSWSAAGEPGEVLSEHRDNVVRQSTQVRPAAVTQAKLGEGKQLDVFAPGESGRVSVTSGGRWREAIVHVPGDYNPDQPAPVLLAYPGYRESAAEMQEFTGLDRLPAVVVYMQGIGDSWEGAPYAKTSDGEDVTFTDDLLASLNVTYNIDRSRIYATGMSNGGGFAGKLACRRPDVFAAVAAVSAAYYPGTYSDCAPGTTSLLDVHGSQDKTINYDGGTRHGSPYLASRSLAEDVAARAGCQAAPVTTSLADDVRRVQWPMCRPSQDGQPRSVVHLRVGDGGHTWPGDDTGRSGNSGETRAGQSGAGSGAAEPTSFSMDATTEVWSFVSEHRL